MIDLKGIVEQIQISMNHEKKFVIRVLGRLSPGGGGDFTLPTRKEADASGVIAYIGPLLMSLDREGNGLVE